MLSVTKKFKFEMAHYLPNHNGNCKFIHGHSYKLEITVTGDIILDHNNPSHGMIIDFTKLKEIVNSNIINKFDHTFTVYNMNLNGEFKKILIDQFGERVNFVDYRPTAENMCLDFYMRLKHEFEQLNIKIKKIRIYETDTSYADFEPED